MFEIIAIVVFLIGYIIGTFIIGPWIVKKIIGE